MKKLLMSSIVVLLLVVIAQGQDYSRLNGERYIPITDERDGQTYMTVKIGDQVWMAENLNYKTDESWCYDNDSANCDEYGRLYRLAAAKKGCPIGWHLPSDEEWTQLTDYLGGKIKAGAKMKERWGVYWSSQHASNESGFSGLPGGARKNNGNYFNIHHHGYWWSSTLDSPYHAWSWKLIDLDTNVYKSYAPKEDGFSVRCLRD